MTQSDAIRSSFGAPGARDLFELCSRAHASSFAGGLACFTVPAPAVSASALFSLAEEDVAVCFDPPTGALRAGLGAAVELRGNGAGRFTEILSAARTHYELARAHPVRGTEAVLPPFLGGLAFSPGSAKSPLWQTFGDAWFVLPRLYYERSGARATLTLAVEPSELDAGLERALCLLDRLAAVPASSYPSPTSRLVAAAPSDVAAFEDRIVAIKEQIAQSSLEKVVAARSLHLELAEAPTPAAILERLAREQHACTCFALKNGMRCFLGATPERLLAKSGLTIETEAMAGSVEAGERKQAALLSSSKDLSEHVIVVREIVREIESLCARISFPESPAAHALRDVVHLYTPIHAELAQPCHVLELVERLHPTPAVGGVPRGAAVTWISEHEPNERGYYASPVGWFDEDGNGAFWVGLRSALLDGAHAHLYAGAGIVAGSDARQELAETELKLAALKSALGALP